jgi:nucleoid DNA-binding protein
MQKVNREILVDEVSKALGRSKEECSHVLKAFFKAIASMTRRRHGHALEIRGFGTFIVTRKSPRIGRNVRTGETVTIPPLKTIRWRPHHGLKLDVQNGYNWRNAFKTITETP